MPLYCDSVSRNARRNCHSERAQSFRRPSGRFAAAIANTSGFSTTSNCRSPPTEAAPSIRGAGPVLAGAALRTHGPKRGAAVFHGHPIDVPGRSLGPPLQTVDFDSVRRCGHGQLLHCLALIQLWPARLRRSRTLFRSIAAPRAQIARGNREFRFPVVYGQPEHLGSSVAVSQVVPKGWLAPGAVWFLILLGNTMRRKPTAPPLVLRRRFPEAGSSMPRIRSWR